MREKFLYNILYFFVDTGIFNDILFKWRQKFLKDKSRLYILGGK